MSAAEDNPIPRLLAQARRSFRAFYTIATPDDQTWFDALVLGHWALNQGASAPRENMPDAAFLVSLVDAEGFRLTTRKVHVAAMTTLVDPSGLRVAVREVGIFDCSAERYQQAAAFYVSWVGFRSKPETVESLLGLPVVQP